MDVEQQFFEVFGKRLAERRRSLRMTQTELADLLGCSQQTVAHYEAGRRRIPISMLPTLSRAVGLSFYELLGESNNDKPKKRGPPPKLQRQLEQISQLPKGKQRFVSQMLETVLETSAS